jgi:hypothetical protein
MDGVSVRWHRREKGRELTAIPTFDFISPLQGSCDLLRSITQAYAALRPGLADLAPLGLRGNGRQAETGRDYLFGKRAASPVNSQQMGTPAN